MLNGNVYEFNSKYLLYLFNVYYLLTVTLHCSASHCNALNDCFLYDALELFTDYVQKMNLETKM